MLSKTARSGDEASCSRQALRSQSSDQRVSGRHLSLKRRSFKGEYRQMGAIVPRESRGSTGPNTVEKASHNAEPSADAIYTAYPNQRCPEEPSPGDCP